MHSLYEIKNSMDIGIFQKAHDYYLKVLEQTGMKFYSDEILKSLENNGAKIVHLLISNVEDENLDTVLEIINKVGPGGSFLGEYHTLKNFTSICPQQQ